MSLVLLKKYNKKKINLIYYIGTLYIIKTNVKILLLYLINYMLLILLLLILSILYEKC